MLNLDNVPQHKKGGKIKKRKSKYNQKQKQKQNTNIKINIAGDKGGSKAPQFIPQYISGGSNPTPQVITIPSQPARGGDINVSSLMDRFAQFEARLGQPVNLDGNLDRRIDELQNLVQQGLDAIPRRPPPMSASASVSSIPSSTFSDYGFTEETPGGVFHNEPTAPLKLDEFATSSSSSSFSPAQLSREGTRFASSQLPTLYFPSLSPLSDLDQQVPQNLPEEEDVPVENLQQRLAQPASGPAENAIVPYFAPPPPAPPILRRGPVVLKLVPETLQSQAGRVEYYFYKAPNGSLYAKRAYEDPMTLPRNYTDVISTANQRNQARNLSSRYRYGDL
jgi:hypothetical protein